MNKNLRLLLGISIISALGVALFGYDGNTASAASGYGYGYSCSSVYGYGYSCNYSAPIGGTYVYTNPGTIIASGVSVPLTDLLNTPTTTTTPVNTPLIIDLSTKGSTTPYGYGNPSNTTLDNGDITFVLPNTGIN